jgi:hypothetical protein
MDSSFLSRLPISLFTYIGTRNSFGFKFCFFDPPVHLFITFTKAARTLIVLQSFIHTLSIRIFSVYSSYRQGFLLAVHFYITLLFMCNTLQSNLHGFRYPGLFVYRSVNLQQLSCLSKCIGCSLLYCLPMIVQYWHILYFETFSPALNTVHP